MRLALDGYLKWLLRNASAGWPRSRYWAVAMAVALVACGNSATLTVEPEPAFSIEKAPTDNGDLQVDTIFATINPLRVLVRSNGKAATGVRVFWTLPSNGQTESWSTVSDDKGFASFQPTLGSKAVAQAVNASLRRSANGPSVDFTITVTPGLPAEIRLISGADQVDSATALLPTPYVVRVSDAYGNAVAGVPVDWNVTTGDGTISPPQSLTGPEGEASARHTLGARIGQNEVKASTPGLDGAVTIRAMAKAAHAVSLSLVSGDNQSAAVGQPMGQDFVVRVTDTHGNGVGEISIDWALTVGDGSLSVTRSTTDADGATAIRLSLGAQSGPRTVIATAAQLPDMPSVVFTASAIAPPPPPPSQPPQTQTGILSYITTTGQDVDDGFIVFAQPCSSFPTNCQSNGVKKILTAKTPTPVPLAPGDYAVSILDVSSNCNVIDNFKKVTVIDRQLVDAPFTVECRPLSIIQVRATTIGTDAPRSFYVSVDGSPFRGVEPDGLAAFKVLDGTHVVTFAVTAANCTILGAKTASVTVLNSGTANVEFIVECVVNPTLRVTVAAAGVNVPAAFGVRIWSEWADDEYGLTVQANGSASIRIPPNWYWLALDPVSNCTVTSALYPEAGLTLGSTADVTFTVVCK